MNWYNKTHPWLGRKAVRGALLLVIIGVVVSVLLALGSKEDATIAAETVPVVQTTSAASYAGNSTINLIGTVRAFSEAAVTAEQSGRVTSARVALGDAVVAGQIIATLENASQQASVLQAEGSYDAALAAAAQSNVGTGEAATQLQSAKNSLTTTLQGAYNTANNAVVSNIDVFFGNPDSRNPYLRISSDGNGGELVRSRIAIQSTLEDWQMFTNTITATSDLDAAADKVKENIAAVTIIIDQFIAVLSQQNNTQYTQSELAGYRSGLSAKKAELISLTGAINASLSSIEASEAAVERATLSATGGTNSAADAQVKQALGSLRAAQATLAKTILRSPIAGTVNSLSVRTGDFIGAQSQIAEVANNNALEVVTFVGESDRNLLKVGAPVIIEDEFNGTITEIAPAVDTNTGKTEVRIASESSVLQNGDVVKISQEVAAATSTQVVVPLSAVKFQITDGAVFIVVDGVLTARPVTLGTIRGGSVVITEGLTSTEVFVADARGLVEGTVVETTN